MHVCKAVIALRKKKLEFKMFAMFYVLLYPSLIRGCWIKDERRIDVDWDFESH